ncbi:Mur ligase [Daldinia caldariorum]|uniref:Mur ligase n=1 Tax=Daldinia caldariorum TaxID=326644 RepID=UPI0020072108|nr:Mur ligase [Daldinia caldariorum]KAI1470199.1 Mur ligase [Daldinia caldariorum]
MAKSYAEAIRLLSTCSKMRNPHSTQKPRPNIFYMGEWLRVLGHDLEGFNVIHVTGTKGKGSTCAFTECLLRTHFQRRQISTKTGLYTSPHLHTERERIRINFQPITEELFAKYFFQVWEALQCAKILYQPGYLQLLTILSIHVFRNEGVGVAIYEVHAGGRYDATNIFHNLVACGFTIIGLDHIPLLGHTLKDIAWHKSGIMKHNTPAFSVFQEQEVRAVLENEAKKVGSLLSFIEPSQRSMKRLAAAECSNLSLAISLANAYLAGECLNDGDIVNSINQYEWPGRFQLIDHGSYRWYLDMAHNETSIPVALAWFRELAREYEAEAELHYSRVLIFGNPVSRDAAKLMDLIVGFCNDHNFFFDTAILTAYERRVDGAKIFDQETAMLHKEAWKSASKPPTVVISPSVKDTLALARHGSIQALITGSSHLISNVHTQLHHE